MAITLKYPEIMIGDDLTAVGSAYYRNIPIIVKDKPEYFFFDKAGKSKKSKEILWQEYVFQLSMCGLMPFGLSVHSIHIDEEEKNIEIITKSGNKYNIETEKIVHSKPPNAITPKGQEILEAIDFFSVKSGRVHDYKIYNNHGATAQNHEHLCHRLIFHKAYGYSGKEDYKDVLTVSEILKENINTFECSETMVRLKLEETMKAAGIRGVKRGTTWNGKPAYLKIKTEHLRRVIRPIYHSEWTNLLFERMHADDSAMPKHIRQIKETFGDPLG